MTPEVVNAYGLNEKQAYFCLVTMIGVPDDDRKGKYSRARKFLPATEAYALAYGVDLTGWQSDSEKRKKYMSCAANANRLLKNDKIIKARRAILENSGWNDESVDKVLLDIMQNGYDKDRINASKEYNKIQQRTEGNVKSDVIGLLREFIGFAGKRLGDGVREVEGGVAQGSHGADRRDQGTA